MNIIIKSLIKKYPNDADLGKMLRQMFNEHEEDFETLKRLQFDKASAAGRGTFDEAAKYREKEKAILDKIKEKFEL